MAILEVLYRLTGGENWDAFRYLTALANGAVVYLLYKITNRQFHSRKADCLVLIGFRVLRSDYFLYDLPLWDYAGADLRAGSFLCLAYFFWKKEGSALPFSPAF